MKSHKSAGIRSRCCRWLALICFLLVVAVALLTASILYNRPVQIRPRWMDNLSDLSPSYPAGPTPDHIILSPAADFPDAIGVNWRTDTLIRDGAVQYREVENADPAVAFTTINAKLNRLDSPEFLKNTAVHCFSATLEGLIPDTIYQYRVGSAKDERWSPYFTFTTPPAESGFSFIYFGDPQDSAQSFGALLAEVDNRLPEASLYLIGGDMVESGEMRDQWDEFFHFTNPVFAANPLAVALGNHDYSYASLNGLKTIAAYFNLPKNGVTGDFNDFYYAFSCGRVRFIVLDSRQYSAAGVAWLEEELRNASGPDFDFAIVMMHYPIYTARNRRRGDNTVRLKTWRTLFDKYGVDLVLAGHDHSYLRSKKLRNNQEAADSQPGTYYVIATAADKFYESDAQEVAAIQYGGTKSYQLITYHPGFGGDARLEYSAFNINHQVIDSFVIHQQAKPETAH